jgi:hypothetical protein
MYVVTDGEPSFESRLRAGKSAKTFKARYSHAACAWTLSPKKRPALAAKARKS